MEKNEIKEERYTVKRPYDLDRFGKEMKDYVKKAKDRDKMKKDILSPKKQVEEPEAERNYGIKRVDLPPTEEPNKEEETDKFLERAENYWKDMVGIMTLLNETNPMIRITSLESPHIMNYLLWRLLSEIKGVKVAEKRLSNTIKQLKLNFGVFTEGK